MWLMALIIVAFIITSGFLVWSNSQIQRAWNDEVQRRNVLALGMAVYQYLHQFGCLPQSAHDLQKIEPEGEVMTYFDPYSGDNRPYQDASTDQDPRPRGEVRFEYCPADSNRPATILICGFGGDGQCLLETWIPMEIT